MAIEGASDSAALLEDLGEEHGHRVLRVRGKGDKVALVPLPPAVGRAIERSAEDRTAGSILLTRRGTRMDRHCATAEEALRRGSRREAALHAPAHAQAHLYHHDAGRRSRLRAVQIAARHADPRTTMGYDRARKNLDRHPNYSLAAYMVLGT